VSRAIARPESGRVLVADGDAERGRSIAAACQARGLDCRLVAHGAAALEAALGDLPDLLVCQLQLPLIEGPRLVAILRANPRTRDTRVLFVGDQAADAERRDLPGDVVPAPAEPDVVAACALSALGRGGAVPAGSPVEGGVEGQLSQLPLADLLQLFHVSRKSGSVEVSRGQARSRRQLGQVALRGGDVVDAAVGDVRGEKALFRLLTWERGSFVFRPETPGVGATIQTPTRALLREGLRQVREWERLAVELPPMSASVTLVVPRSSLPNVIHPLTQEVLVVLDLYSKVQDVVDHCSYPDYQVLRTLHTLVQRGMVELQREPETPQLARELRLFPPARTARLREWLEVDRPGVPGAREAKLLVVTSGPGALREFSRLLGRLPGVELDPKVERGEIGADDLVGVGRVAVDAEVGIELVHVPAAARFAPLWPVAGHAALGTLLLLAGPVDQAEATVREAGRALAALPRARVFYLWLLEKRERVSPEDVRQHLSLADEGALFLIPMESPEKGLVLLREVFGRVLP
jgi:CheY-like chemotaxis protein